MLKINGDVMRLLWLLFSMAIIISAQAQTEKCGSALQRNARIQANPALMEKVARLDHFTQNWIAQQNGKLQLRAPITLPVVVHVLWREATENISNEQIQSQIAVLNEDFRQLNADFSNTPAAFRSVAADVEIEFCLATVDPDGNPTSGITRTRTDIDNIGETEDWYSTAWGGKDAWDVDRYINIWVCDIGDDGTLGFATIPGTADPPESDGLVIGHQYFGTLGTAANTEFNNLGRTATHEMGHYFNLEHLWGPDRGGCEEDDFVSDTPDQFEDSFACPSFPLFDDCTSGGNGVQFMNFMDYSDDACMNMFTQGQKMRMLAALNGARSGLIGIQACTVATTTVQAQVFTQMHVFPNPALDILEMDYGVLANLNELHFQIVDVQGKLWSAWQGDQIKTLSLQEWTSGIYFLRCLENPAFSQRFIKL
jgi:hypothetical protein